MRLRAISSIIATFVYLAFLQTLPRIASGPLPADSERLINIELLSEHSNPDARIRREADSSLPDHLEFNVPMHNTDVTLRMKRSRFLPTSTSHSPLSKPFMEQAGVYTDETNFVTMIVKREAGEYRLQAGVYTDETNSGTMIVKREAGEYRLQTLDDDLEPPAHIAIRAERGIWIGITNLFNVVNRDPAAPVEILNLADRNRHRMATLNGMLGQQKNGIQQPVSNGRQQREGNRRSKRNAVEHIVELAFVVDYADYENWVALEGASNAINEMTIWYTFIAEAINIRYRTIVDPDIAIGTVVTSFKILTNESDDDFIEDLIDSGSFDGVSGLNAFRSWYQDPANGIPMADHYMYFTGSPIDNYNTNPNYNYYTGPNNDYNTNPNYNYHRIPNYNYYTSPNYNYHRSPNYNYHRSPNYNYHRNPNYNYYRSPNYDYYRSPNCNFYTNRDSFTNATQNKQFIALRIRAIVQMTSGVPQTGTTKEDEEETNPGKISTVAELQEMHREENKGWLVEIL
ncbi:S-antigen protein [Plakobranchus ocellatus]|uniref:S-antigen protein n=1 Tax=Plakobranchus ocellatus TaxID=259542 RepID=A0AAV3ZKJ3_9GAST|nr:S-antigen protein [Plakobranchus ocellatus]